MIDGNTETKMRTSLSGPWRPNAAREPAIADLIRCLMAMGARVTGLDAGYSRGFRGMPNELGYNLTLGARRAIAARDADSSARLH